MGEFTVAGQNYKSAKMDAMKQFHVSRRLAPVLAGIAPLLKDLKGADPLAALAPAAEAIGGISDADAEYILNACLDLCQRQQPGNIGWARVRSSGGLMFEDIGMAEMLQIAWAVLSENLGGFFSGLPGPTSGGTVRQE